MKRLCQYSSSSSSDTNSDSEENIKEPKEKRRFNFFALNDDDDDDEEEGNKREGKKGEGKTSSAADTTNLWYKSPQKTVSDFVIIHDGSSVSLPSVDFWEGISEEEIANAGKLKEHFLKNVTDSETLITPFDEEEEELTAPEQEASMSSKALVPDLQESSCVKAYTSKKQRLHKSENRGTTSESLPGINSMQTKRKLYFVHSKIGPYQSKAFPGPNQIAKKKETTIQAHVGSINRIRWCVAQYSHLLLSVADDSLVKIWNVWSLLEPCVQTVTHHSSCVKDAEWSSCGRHVLTCGYDRKAVVTDVETVPQNQTLPESLINATIFMHRICFTNPFPPRDCAMCSLPPVNANLVLTGTKNVVYSWDLRTAQEPVRQYNYKDSLGTIQDIVFSRDGETFFSCCDIISQDSADRNIMAWHCQTGVVLSNQIYHEKYICARLCQHPRENTFLAQSQGGYIALFSSKSPFKMDKSKRFEKHKLLGYKIGFDISFDGRYVSSGSSDGKVYTYHFYNGLMLQSLETGFSVTMDVAYHPVLPSTLACCSLDGEIQIWR
ncbi:WD repeat-containing protein 25-like [Octopus sinensis]|uniref:WD repeat-containing protein 25-like n=1 Tax=Octopus sinensis TaxID=2607531 RepID=A0A7E6FNY2_9MOLL|nr:WD repeat-containing protein 25-like [Octopus sinensis]